MGKGDRKTRKGKIWLGTHGRARRPLESKHKPKTEASNQPTEN